jgi:hypothetical protein
MKRSSASQFAILDGHIQYWNNSYCIALASDGYMIVMEKNQANDGLKCLTGFELNRSESQPEATAVYDEMIVKLPEPTSVLCPIKRIGDGEGFDEESDEGSKQSLQYYLKVLDPGKEYEICNETTFLPRVTLRLQNIHASEIDKVTLSGFS